MQGKCPEELEKMLFRTWVFVRSCSAEQSDAPKPGSVKNCLVDEPTVRWTILAVKLVLLTLSCIFNASL